MKNLKKNMLAYAFLMPILITTIILLYFPVASVFKSSLYDYSAANMWRQKFIGIENFTKLFTADDIFWGSLWLSVKWVISCVALQCFTGIGLALFLNQKFKGKGVVRSIIISPYIISGVLTSTLFLLLFNPNIGLINDMLLKIGLIDTKIMWLSDPSIAFVSAVFAQSWRSFPFFLILFMAALQTIPHELYEAAKVDGSNYYKTLTKITLPLLKETIIFACLLRALWEFNNIDILYALTKGGPGNATTTTAMYLAKTAIKSGNFGYGSAIAVAGMVFLFIICGLIMLILGYGRRKKHD